jgi:hypothetical protein
MQTGWGQKPSTKGVNFLPKTKSDIKAALEQALTKSDTIYFDKGIYLLSPITIQNRKRLYLKFNETILIAAPGTSAKHLLNIEGVQELTLAGTVTFDGNYPAAKQTENFLQVTAPAADPRSCIFGDISVKRIALSGILLISADPTVKGYKKVSINSYTEINGLGCSSPGGRDIMYGFYIRGGHKVISINRILIRNDLSAWTSHDTLVNYKNFTVSAEVDPQNYPRPDSLYIGSLRATCGMSGFYIQAVSKVHLHEIIFDSTMRKPGVKDELAYKNITYKNYAYFKASWGAFKTPQAKWKIDRYVIKNTNPFLQREANFMMGLWFNTGTYGVVVDTFETDMPFSLGPDGEHPGVIAGHHTIHTMVLNLPQKPSSMISLGDGLTIGKLVLGKNHELPLALVNCTINEIEQLGDEQVVITMQQMNVFDSLTTETNRGTVINKCKAKNLKWQVYLRANSADYTGNRAPKGGYKYQFRNFSGNNYLQVFLIKDGKLQDLRNPEIAGAEWVGNFFSYVNVDMENCTFKHNSNDPGELTYALFDPAGNFRNGSKRKQPGKMPDVFSGNHFKNVRLYKPEHDETGTLINQ